MFRAVLSRASISDQWKFDRLVSRMAVVVVDQSESPLMEVVGFCLCVFTLIATVQFAMCLDWYYARTLNQSPWGTPCTPNLIVIILVTWSIYSIIMYNGDTIQRHTIPSLHKKVPKKKSSPCRDCSIHAWMHWLTKCKNQRCHAHSDVHSIT